MKGYFITGTDTAVGKTYVVSKLLSYFQAQKKPALALKPVASGGVPWRDTWICEDVLALQNAQPHVTSPICRWAYQEAIAPHLAAKKQGEDLAAEAIASWCKERTNGLEEVVLIEGAGGVLVPLNTDETWVDVIRALDLPVIFVVGLRLGCINHASLTEYVMLAENLKVEGWIANALEPDLPEVAGILKTLKTILKTPCLGEVLHQGEISLIQEAKKE